MRLSFPDYVLPGNVAGGMVLQGSGALTGTAVAVQEARSRHGGPTGACASVVPEAHERRRRTFRLPSNADAAGPLRQGSNNAPPTGAGPILTTAGQRLGAQRRAVAAHGAT